jgi:hypothetical protein
MIMQFSEPELRHHFGPSSLLAGNRFLLTWDRAAGYEADAYNACGFISMAVTAPSC